MPEVSQQNRHIGALHRQRTCGDFTFGWWQTTNICAVPKHGHDEAHFMFALGGRYTSSAKGDAGPHGGHFIFNPPLTFHSDRFESPGSFFSLSLSDSLWRSLGGDGPCETPTYLPQLRPRMTALHLVRQLANWDPASSLICEPLCLEILSEILAQPCKQRSRPKWLARSLAAIRERYAGAVSLADLAHEAGVHSHHFARVFRRFEGCSAGEYLLATRLQAAAELLATGHLSISEIALDCGFADQSHFTKRFSAAYGLAPGEYRRKLGVGRRIYASFGQDRNAKGR